MIAGGLTLGVRTFTDTSGLTLVFDVNGMQFQVKRNGIFYVDATGTPTAIWGIYPE